VAHDHAHGHGHHHHGPAADADRRWLAVALGVIATFMVVEVVAGILADSLALLSDAAHMLTDAGAIAVALYAAGLAARPPAGRFTFGFGRAEILSAQANGATLLVLAGVIAVEGIRRLWSVPDVDGGFVVVVGLLGACVNVAAALALGKAERRSLNVEGARAHVMTDLFASLAADVLVKPGDDCHAVRRSLQAMVNERFSIEHVTLQVDHAPAGDRLLEIEPRR
jgi:cobalt-zinc-cadmium efflux system protein